MKLGPDDVAALKLGPDDVPKAYLGPDLVFGGVVANPQVTDANVDVAGTTLTINFDMSVTGNAGFTLKADDVVVALSAPGGTGPQITFTTEQVYQGAILTLDYAPGDVVSDPAGDPLLTFSGTAVTNNSTVPAAGAVLAFEALAPDAVDYEMLGVKLGTGGLTENRASSIWLLDHAGARQEFGANEPGYEGGRVTGAVGSRVVYADNPPGTPLPEIPYIVHAPESTNYFLNSDAPVTQSISGLSAIPHTCWIEGTGSATLSGGATGVATEGNPVSFTPTGDVTVTIGGSVDICQVESNPIMSPYIPTAGAPVTRDACGLSFDSVNHTDVEGAYYMEVDL